MIFLSNLELLRGLWAFYRNCNLLPW